jgi:hypothetical protein
MIKLFLPYNKTILRTNIVYSIILTIISRAIPVLASTFLGLTLHSSHSQIYIALWYFIIWIMTGGFFLSVFHFETSRKNEYYFYYNLGISKIKLISYTYILHMIFILPLIYILQYV